MNLDFSDPQKAIQDIQQQIHRLLPDSGLSAQEKADINKVMSGTASLSKLFNIGKLSEDESMERLKSVVSEAEEKNATFAEIAQKLSDGVIGKR